MKSIIKRFRRGEDGAVTVDWVVLCAAIVGLSIAVITIIGNGALDKSTGLGAHLSSRDVSTH